MKPCCVCPSAARGEELLVCVQWKANNSGDVHGLNRSTATDGHGIADYPGRAWLRFTEAVSVLLETYQSRTDAPLQSVFTCACFSAIRDNVPKSVRSDHG